MTNRAYRALFAAIIIVALLIRLIPVRNNNFYFTMDQGDDAVHVREIIYRHKIALIGPETGIAGFHHGPLWYYFIAPGYLIFSGHPAGAVFMLILLNVALTAIIIIKISRHVSKPIGLLVGASLQFFWWFYDTSRYGFNPFPTVFLSIVLIFLLSDFLQEKKRSLLSLTINSYVLAAIPVGLTFNSEAAAAVAFSALWLTIGIWGFITKRLTVHLAAISLLMLAIFFIPRTISEIQTGFSQSKVLRREFVNPNGIFSQTRYKFISLKFTEILTKKIVPVSDKIGAIILLVSFILFWKLDAKNHFVKHFTYLSLVLFAISWAWFGSNKGWQVWHTVYMRPLLFISILLMLANIIKVSPISVKRFALFLLTAILVSQFLFFKDRYLKFAKTSADPSILTNELAAVDWVYQEAQGQGFYVYSYLPSVYDYPYQYLFWWRGTKKYGYVPCEYSTFPNIPDFFIPGLKYYQSPQRSCTNLRFLIIEPDKNQNNRQVWLNQVRKDTTLLKEATFGTISVEKRQF